MKLPPSTLKDLQASLEMASRDVSASWMRVVAHSLEGCAREILEAADADVKTSELTQTTYRSTPR